MAMTEGSSQKSEMDFNLQVTFQLIGFALIRKWYFYGTQFTIYNVILMNERNQKCLKNHSQAQRVSSGRSKVISRGADLGLLSLYIGLF